MNLFFLLRKAGRTALLLLICLIFSAPVFAEVVTDGTMGMDGAIAGPHYEILSEYGRQAGENLFHSFGIFNIGAGEIADFTVPGSVQNIISRITGGDVSLIDGTLRSTQAGSSGPSEANLYFLNPAGFVFGPDAYLDTGGSFHASTASYLRFGENDRYYSAGDSEILSTESPAAFGFLDAQTGKIVFEGGGLVEAGKAPEGFSVAEGNRISVVAGDVEIRGTYYDDYGELVPLNRIGAPGGRIDIAAPASAGEAVFTETGYDVSSFESLGKITVSDYSLVSTSGKGSGDVFIRSGRFYLRDSTIEADTEDSDGGIIDIGADEITLSYSNIFSDTFGVGTCGSIILSGAGGGYAESVHITDYSWIFTNTEMEDPDAGDAGTITIKTKTLSMTDNSEIYSYSYGSGDGGDIFLDVEDSVSVSGSRIYASAEGYGADAGDAGRIVVEAREISVLDYSRISTDTYGGGRGGSIFIGGPNRNPADSMEIGGGSTIFAGAMGSGDGGTVDLTAKAVELADGSTIASESGPEGYTDASGKGGDVTIHATETLVFRGQNDDGRASAVYTTAKSLEPEEGKGNAGNISIRAGYVRFTDNGGVNAATEGPGNAGDISMEVTRLELDAGAEISSASRAEEDGGDAGSVTIRAVETVELFDGSFITTEAEDAGKGWIDIQTGDRLYAVDSRITTSIKKGGEDAGNIEIGRPEFVVLKNSRVIANAWEGRGGNIQITSDQFIQSPNSLVDASSRLGIDGTVNIESPETDVSSGLTVLPSNFLNAARWLRIPCALRSGEQVSRFTSRGRDAAETSFDDWMQSPPVWKVGGKR